MIIDTRYLGTLSAHLCEPKFVDEDGRELRPMDTDLLVRATAEAMRQPLLHAYDETVNWLYEEGVHIESARYWARLIIQKIAA